MPQTEDKLSKKKDRLLKKLAYYKKQRDLCLKQYSKFRQLVEEVSYIVSAYGFKSAN